MCKKIFEDSQRFRESLEQLKSDAELSNKYVVFKDGRVHASSDDFESAYLKGMDLFGKRCFYVDRVGE
jgi:hypothetical protein